MKLKWIAVIFIFLPLALKFGCALLPEQSSTKPELFGAWGGEHIALNITQDSITLEYDCGRGTIDEPIRLDESGEFEADGTYIYEHGGPVREEEKPEQLPANYRGHVEGSKMTLTVKLKSTGAGLGAFVLQLGRAPRLFKCL
ncbi:hypothetical protein HUU05_25290 [candidate division KSB1 bacterium]|nr:hypothetical protein [candidate division KSB1 bacterium]